MCVWGDMKIIVLLRQLLDGGRSQMISRLIISCPGDWASPWNPSIAINKSQKFIFATYPRIWIKCLAWALSEFLHDVCPGMKWRNTRLLKYDLLANKKLTKKVSIYPKFPRLLPRHLLVTDSHQIKTMDRSCLWEASHNSNRRLPCWATRPI